MCLILDGEIRSTGTIKTQKGNILEVLHILAKVGKSERILDVINFSDQKFKVGPAKISVVPRVNVSAKTGQGFLNYATFDGIIV